MKRIFFLIAVILLFNAPVIADDVKPAADVELPNIFIWALPDDEPDETQEENVKKSKKDKDNKTEDEQSYEVLTTEEEPIVLNATTLKGYAEFVEGAEDVLYMEDPTKFELNIKAPEKIATEALVDKNKVFSPGQNLYSLSKFKGEEYYISPRTRNFTQQDGKWSFGTTFNSEISTSQLENATSLFTKYDSKYFSLSSKYKKNSMTTTQIQTDNFSVTPEWKINNMFSLREELSTDMTRNRRSSELIFSVNPLGKKDIDRMRFDIGAKRTYDINTGNTWSQLNFTTNFKL